MNSAFVPAENGPTSAITARSARSTDVVMRDVQEVNGDVSDNLLTQIKTLLDEEGNDIGAFFDKFEGKRNVELSRGIIPLCIELSNPNREGTVLSTAYVNNFSELDSESRQAFKSMKESFIARDSIARNAFLLFKGRINPDIWNCCSRLCFASIAVDGRKYRLMQEFLLIHEYAEQAHTEMERNITRLEQRRRGVGTSNIIFRSKSRRERETDAGVHHETRRREQLNSFAAFVSEVLPFLYGVKSSPRLTPPPPYKLCTEAICCLLGVSRNFLYYRKLTKDHLRVTEEELSSIVDSSGVRMRQHRRLGIRMNYPPVQELQDFDCGCDMPCFNATPVWTLVSEYDDFSTLSKQLNARHKENCYLLNKMYDHLGSTTTKVCNNALAALYNVSTTLIASVRACLDALCHGLSTFSDDENVSYGEYRKELLGSGTSRYKYDRGHPLNRYPTAVRESVERHLDMVLRADPEGSDGSSVCRVYSPEINTYQKLQETLKEALDFGEGNDWELSASTIQRMVNAYLKKRNYSAISFSQSDHNACPNCKAMQYAILQFDHEVKKSRQSLHDLRAGPRPFEQFDHIQEMKLSQKLDMKIFQAKNCVSELQNHTGRDARIREAIKKLSQMFFDIEDSYRQLPVSKRESNGWKWNTYPDRARITHQDDMTKVDLPHFFVEASSDITRWRFDVNAHVNAVSGDAVVFSHEQGGGPKNASLIIEEILLEHILNCQGESVKVIVSDNASVGKNWATTIALPQYIVDQGMAEIVIIVFLENNHGKWLADMLFGQFQTRRKRTTMLSVDDMLAGFEAIKKKNGNVYGFALNPLSSIDFVAVFESLGYGITAPNKFGFLKRNIHFSAACTPGARGRLPAEIARFIGDLLPEDRGMVRISTEPPSGRSQQELPYGERYFDVPAARTEITNGNIRVAESSPFALEEVPLVVPKDKSYSPGGSGVVSHRTTTHVGYNGIEFSKTDACAEMRHAETPLVRRAWPKGLIKPYGSSGESEEPVYGVESTKCAPVNWIAREPVHHFGQSDREWKARYPPRNMLNAKFQKGPRVAEPWVPTSTYDEPPFPIREKTSACVAMKAFAEQHTDLSEPVHTLYLLREVFRHEGDRGDVCDVWMQRRVSVPSHEALQRYKRELDLFVSREEGYPKAPITLKQAFKKDVGVAAAVESELSRNGPFRTSSARRKAEDEVLSKMFAAAQRQPGRMDRFKHIVELDHERFSHELKEFREVQKYFDESRGLLPTTATH